MSFLITVDGRWSRANVCVVANRRDFGGLVYYTLYAKIDFTIRSLADEERRREKPSVRTADPRFAFPFPFFFRKIAHTRAHARATSSASQRHNSAHGKRIIPRKSASICCACSRGRKCRLSGIVGSLLLLIAYISWIVIRNERVSPCPSFNIYNYCLCIYVYVYIYSFYKTCVLRVFFFLFIFLGITLTWSLNRDFTQTRQSLAREVITRTSFFFPLSCGSVRKRHICWAKSPTVLG